MAEQLIAVAEQETGLLREQMLRTGVLDWGLFAAAWRRTVRRVVLGESSRDDERVTEFLTALRNQANWSYLHPGNRARRRELRSRLAAAVGRAEPGSLAALVAATPTTGRLDRVDQLPQWLFAFDPAGMAVHARSGWRERASP